MGGYKQIKTEISGSEGSDQSCPPSPLGYRVASQRVPVCQMRQSVGVQIPQPKKSASISTPASISPH